MSISSTGARVACVPMFYRNAAGLAAGHFAKLKNADARSGRCARWETLDLLVEALWPNEDFELLVLSTSSIAEAASSKRGLFA